jgi:hypothetical protein
MVTADSPRPSRLAFTHHPYLQTEELANEVALRVVSRESLDEVYEKVWKRTGTKGDLVYLPVK